MRTVHADGTDADVITMRRSLCQATAVRVAMKVESAMKDAARKQGVILVPEMQRMFSDLAAVAVDAMMGECSLVESSERVTPDHVAPDETTQQVIDRKVKPEIAAKIAEAMLSSGLAASTLAIPKTGLSALFVGTALVLRPEIDTALLNMPQLQYGDATKVIRDLPMKDGA